jgi:hypothetical protein
MQDSDATVHLMRICMGPSHKWRTPKALSITISWERANIETCRRMTLIVIVAQASDKGIKRGVGQNGYSTRGVCGGCASAVRGHLAPKCGGPQALTEVIGHTRRR